MEAEGRSAEVAEGELQGKKLPLIITLAEFCDVKKDSGKVAGWDRFIFSKMIFMWNGGP